MFIRLTRIDTPLSDFSSIYTEKKKKERQKEKDEKKVIMHEQEVSELLILILKSKRPMRMPPNQHIIGKFEHDLYQSSLSSLNRKHDRMSGLQCYTSSTNTKSIPQSMIDFKV